MARVIIINSYSKFIPWKSELAVTKEIVLFNLNLLSWLLNLEARLFESKIFPFYRKYIYLNVISVSELATTPYYKWMKTSYFLAIIRKQRVENALLKQFIWSFDLPTRSETPQLLIVASVSSLRLSHISQSQKRTKETDFRFVLNCLGKCCSYRKIS